jgi:hypothetical protein
VIPARGRMPATLFVGRHQREVVLLAADGIDLLRLDLAEPTLASEAIAFVGRGLERPRLVVRQPLDFFELALKAGPDFWRATSGHRVLDLRYLDSALLDVAACGFESGFDTLHGTARDAAIDAQILRRAWQLCGQCRDAPTAAVV